MPVFKTEAEYQAWLQGRPALKARNSAPESVAVKVAPAAPTTISNKALNKTEARFYDILKQRHGETNVIPHGITFLLGPRKRYTPDFVTISPPIIYECKGGFIRDDARTSFLAAAGRFTCFRFVLAQWKDRVWTEREFK